MTLGMYIMVFFAVLVCATAMFLAWRLVRLFGRETAEEERQDLNEQKKGFSSGEETSAQ